MKDNTDMKIEAYLGGQLSPDERKAFEEEMAQNVDLRDKVRLSNQINHFAGDRYLLDDALSENKGEYANTLRDELSSSTSKKFQKDLSAIANTYHSNSRDDKNSRKGGKLIYFITSAAAVVLLVLGLNFFGTSNPSALYDSFYSPADLPSFTTRSDASEDLLTGMNAFNSEKYEEAIKRLTAFAKAEDELSAYLYTGTAYLELGQLENALNEYNKLANSASLDASKAQWFKTLLYLKTEQTELAIKQLKEITSDASNFNYAKAASLLKKLE